MGSLTTILLAGLLVTAVALGIAPLVTPSKSEFSVRFARGWATLTGTLLWVLAIGLFLVIPFTGPVSITIAPGVGFVVDSTASLMLGIVTTVGWCANRFAGRYVSGEPYEARYWCWSGTTLGMVAVMVVSGNLAMFLGAWIGTSSALHQLLMLEHDRHEARKAAWTKFAISRIGDVCLLAALLLLYRSFGTVEFSELSQSLQTLNTRSLNTPSISHGLIAWLIVIGAMTKSAQLPFHFWLPETLETPTPVSALMHAGVINAGGYLILRTYPLIIDVPSARILLVGVGTITACVGAMVMLTQTSIKRALAYSTIAQMGFMMLQCGLGAYAAAMLHIMAHSAYKAYAFLNSGTIPQHHSLNVSLQEKSDISRDGLLLQGLLRFPRTCATIVALLAYGIPLLVWKIDPIEKTGGIVLGALFTLGLGHWLAGVFLTASRRVAIQATGIVFLMGLFATSALQCVQWIMAPDYSYRIAQVSLTLTLPLASLFLIPLILESLAAHGRYPHLASKLYIGALNGFYIDAWVRKIARSFQPFMNARNLRFSEQSQTPSQELSVRQ